MAQGNRAATCFAFHIAASSEAALVAAAAQVVSIGSESSVAQFESIFGAGKSAHDFAAPN